MNGKTDTRWKILVCAALALGACTYRGLPAHGGGKRFYGEQMIIGQAARAAVAQLDFSRLRGRKVTVILVAVADDGTGSFSPGGLDWNLLLTGRPAKTFSSTQTRGNTTDERRPHFYAEANARFDGRSSYLADAFSTTRDMEFLTAQVIKKLLSEGVDVTSSADVELFVLVEVFGTDRYRFDAFFFSRDALRAFCKLSAYAVDRADRSIVLPEITATQGAEYSEESILGFGPFSVRKRLIDGEEDFEGMPDTAVRAARTDPADAQPVAVPAQTEPEPELKKTAETVHIPRGRPLMIEQYLEAQTRLMPEEREMLRFKKLRGDKKGFAREKGIE